MTTAGGVVWRADLDGWRAEVEEARGRLTFLGRAGGRNLLLRHTGAPDPLKFGGHRVWLGPQDEWSHFWPPPANWEMMPAEGVSLRGSSELEVRSPKGPGTDESIRRRYRWSAPGVLACTVSWTELVPSHRQAINVFQLSENTEVIATPVPSPAAPMGYVQLPISGRSATRYVFAPPPQAETRESRLLLRRQPTEEKLGFPLQPLTARWKDAELTLVQGKVHGVPVSSPGADYPSHVYLGGDAWPVLEIEQLSPRLRPQFPGAPVGQTVLLKLRSVSDG